MNLWVCMGVYSYTDPQVSMDLLRAVLQPSFNDDIMAVFRKYHTFFEKAAHNVKENIGDEVHADQLIKEACRNVLEHAKVMFAESEAKKPSCEVSVKRPRGCEESSSQRGSPVPKKAKCEAIKKEGPKWEPSRLNESSTFVLGSRANN
ncbi:deoxynucleotidyltransferase terminal-interacting protein 1-like isoform X2 [Syngnathus acus]|uniref:deoxynucleotidyltransferase terminal-interacting protein 1-like isoform X2 n=1 Tax=Syngnathus acus TaxID=161584 RepID=UPI001885C6DD|nr:deoxynucleotidyltransferase terminal-interacting protein 1-like isoform X2 [Syngnathus acus]